MRPRRTLPLVLLALLPLAASCTGERAPGASDPPAAAGGALLTYREGGETRSITALSQLEPYMPELDQLAGVEAVERYRRAAEALVLDRSLVPPGADVASELRSDPARYHELHRDAVLDLFMKEQAEDVAITPEDVAEQFAANEARYRRPAARFVHHIFRRDDPARPGAAEEMLASLADRARRGESFGALAREHSDSETRRLDGRLGFVSKGTLAPEVEAVVDQLQENEVSAPLRVPGGAAIFMVSEVVEEKRFPLEDVRPIVVETLRLERRRAQVARLAEGETPPEGSHILEPAIVAGLLSSGSGSEAVLEIGAFRMTAAELGALLEKEPRSEMLVAAPLQERVSKAYRALVDRELLYRKLAAGWAAEDPARAAEIDRRVEARGRPLLVQARLEERMRKLAASSPEELRHFYDDNRHLYLAPLRMKARSLTVPLRQQPARDIALLEEARNELVAGTTTFEEVARKLGGQVQDLGWLGPPELAAMVPKVRTYLMEIDGPGFTVPYQLNRGLQMVWVEERPEPVQLPYEEVASRVLDDYYVRNQQKLFRRVADGLLSEASTRLDEEALRQALAPRAPGASAS